MTNTEQLRQLLKNAIAEGFTSEDIEDLARDIESEREEEELHEDLLDELQSDAADTLTDFLEELDYFEDDTDYTEDREAVYNALQLVRDGQLKVEAKKCGNGCSCSASCHSDSEDAAAIYNYLCKLLLS